MSRPALIRLVGALTGVAVFLVLFAAIGGASGLFAGFVGAGVSWWLAERRWRRTASAEGQRADLEERVRNPPP